jgi:hypothetical protein
MKRKKANLVNEVAMDVRFGHKLANCEFSTMKLPSMSVLSLRDGQFFFANTHPKSVFFFSFENLISLPPTF